MTKRYTTEDQKKGEMAVRFFGVTATFEGNKKRNRRRGREGKQRAGTSIGVDREIKGTSWNTEGGLSIHLRSAALSLEGAKRRVKTQRARLTMGGKPDLVPPIWGTGVSVLRGRKNETKSTKARRMAEGACL